MKYQEIQSNEIIQKTADALTANGMETTIVENGAEAAKKVLELIPEGAEVMDMTSVTIHDIGLDEVLNSNKYNSVRNNLNSLDRKTDSLKMQKLGAAPEYATGSAHAVTQDGIIMIASNTGSQLPAEAYGASHVVYVIGAQKIVENRDAGFKRIYDYVLPLESVRARKAYGLPETWNSNVSKLLIINKELTPNRIHVILVKEILGF